MIYKRNNWDNYTLSKLNIFSGRPFYLHKKTSYTLAEYICKPFIQQKVVSRVYKKRVEIFLFHSWLGPPLRESQSCLFLSNADLQNGNIYTLCTMLGYVGKPL